MIKVNIDNWPKPSKVVAKELIEKYGEPDESTFNMLIWYNNGSWKKTIVYKRGVLHCFPLNHSDLVEQVIDYKMPINKINEITAFNGSVVYKRTDGEIIVKCENEANNYLTLNLVHEIITGKKSIDEARLFYGETTMALMKGLTSDYAEKLLFQVENGKTTDTDVQLNLLPVTE